MTTETSNNLAPDTGPLGFPSRVVMTPVDGAIYLEEKLMKEIQLTQGKGALVDDEDYERINQHKWYAHEDGKTFYASRHKVSTSGKKISIQMHRDVLGMSYGDGRMCDHKNRNGIDNQKDNLREATKSLNVRNSGIYKNNSSGYKGVKWQKSTKTWVAYKRVNGIQTYLGSYKDPAEASLVYERTPHER